MYKFSDVLNGKRRASEKDPVKIEGTHLNIAVLGKAQNGKSSLINGWWNAIEPGENMNFTEIFEIGSGQNSMTMTTEPLPITRNIIAWDTKGVYTFDDD